jgi:hypothetical protein
MYRTIKARWVKLFGWMYRLVFMVRKPEFTTDARKMVIGWDKKTREVFLFKSIDEITLYDCKRLGLEPASRDFHLEVWVNDDVIFRLGKTEIKFEFNFEKEVQKQFQKFGQKEGEKGAPYLESTVKALYPGFYEEWQKYIESVSHIK